MSEPEGFREFVAARSPALLRTAWMLTGDSHLAEDLLQTALARTWPHWSRLRDGQPEAYVRRVMVRVTGSWWRRRWRGETPTAAVPEAASGDAFAAVDERAVLVEALGGLPIRQRQVVVLRYYDDLSERQVADLLGCSVGTVKSQAAKGLAKLRAALGTDADTDVSDAGVAYARVEDAGMADVDVTDFGVADAGAADIGVEERR